MKFPQNVAIIESGLYEFADGKAEENLVYRLLKCQFIYTVNTSLNTLKPGMVVRIRKSLNPAISGNL
jgi:hypothetical protein